MYVEKNFQSMRDPLLSWRFAFQITAMNKVCWTTREKWLLNYSQMQDL